jgi:hypothetical protein
LLSSHENYLNNLYTGNTGIDEKLKKFGSDIEEGTNIQGFFDEISKIALGIAEEMERYLKVVKEREDLEEQGGEPVPVDEDDLENQKPQVTYSEGNCFDSPDEATQTIAGIRESVENRHKTVVGVIHVAS